MSTLPLSGVNSSFFSAIPLSRFSLKKSRFFAYFQLEQMRSMRSAQWHSDDSATSFHYSAKLIRSAKLSFVCVFCLFVKLRLSSGKIGLSSRRCNIVPVVPPVSGKNDNSCLLRSFVRSVPLFRSLMLTPMHLAFIYRGLLAAKVNISRETMKTYGCVHGSQSTPLTYDLIII